MKNVIYGMLIWLFLNAMACGSSAPAGIQGSEAFLQDVREVSGLWIQQQADSDGNRLGINFQEATQSADRYVSNFSIFFVDTSGQNLGQVEGSAEIRESNIRLIVPGVLDIAGDFSVDARSLNIADLQMVRVNADGTIPALQGQGGIRGRILVPSTTRAAALFMPGEIIVSYKNNNTAALKIKETSPDYEIINSVPGISTVVRKKESLSALKMGNSRDFKDVLIELKNLHLWTLEQVKRLNEDPDVLFAEPNYIRKALRVPNDQLYNLQWHYDQMGLSEAWDITTGSNDIIVAVIDTGVLLNHPDFAGRLTNTGYDFVNARISNDGGGPDNDPTDPGDDPNRLSGGSSWHGSHVAGTIGAATNNSIGVAGITWATKIMPIRVLGVGGGSDADIANGILYAAGLANQSGRVPPQKANVINLSLGGDEQSFVVDSAVSRAIANGVTVIAAAGNANKVTTGSPALSPGAITVGATGFSLGKAPYSNFGSAIDVVAPGGDMRGDVNNDSYPDGILSVLKDNRSGELSYQFYEGTSMAAPHVAGLVALMLSVNNRLTPREIFDILSQTSRDLGVSGKDDIFGYGLVQAPAALRRASAGGGTSVPPADSALSVSADSISLSSANTGQNILVNSTGSQELSNLSVRIQGTAGWLAATLDRTHTPAVMQVTANPQGLANGNYNAVIVISSGAQSIEVHVGFRVGTVTSVLSGGVAVGVLSADSLEVINAMMTNQSLNYAYQFDGLEVGDYYVVAASDSDGDGTPCEDNEYCGGFPLLNQLIAVPVTPNRITEGIDIMLSLPSVSVRTSPDNDDSIFRRVWDYVNN